jgi:predicted RNA-binding Zn-ribbon protein involved in translation (DUF1610 family)
MCPFDLEPSLEKVANDLACLVPGRGLRFARREGGVRRHIDVFADDALVGTIPLSDDENAEEIEYSLAHEALDIARTIFGPASVECCRCGGDVYVDADDEERPVTTVWKCLNCGFRAPLGQAQSLCGLSADTRETPLR